MIRSLSREYAIPSRDLMINHTFLQSLQVLINKNEPVHCDGKELEIVRLKKRSTTKIADLCYSIEDAVTSIQKCDIEFQCFQEFIVAALMQNSQPALLECTFGLIKNCNTKQLDDYSILISALANQLTQSFERTTLLALILVTYCFFKKGFKDLPIKPIQNAIPIFSKYPEHFELSMIFIEQFLANDNQLYPAMIKVAMLEVTRLSNQFDIKYDCTHILTVITPKCLALDTNALMLFSTISDIEPTPHTIQLTEKIAAEVSEKISQKIVFSEHNSEIKTNEAFSVNIKAALNVEGVIGRTDFSSEYPEFALEEILEQSQLELLGIAQPLVQRENSIASSSFIEEIAKRTPNHYVSLLFLSALLRGFEYKTLPPISEKFIINNIIDPNYDIFNKSNEKVIFARRYAIDTIAQRWPTVIRTLFLQAEDYPFLFAELCNNIHQKISTIDLQKIIDDSVVFSIVHVLSYFTSHPHNDAWSNIFIFIVAAIEKEPIMKLFFSNSVFVTSFLSYYVHDELRSVIVGSVTRFLSSATDADDVSVTAEFFIDVMKTVEERHLVAVSELIAGLKSSLSYRPNLVPAFSSVTSPLIELFLQYPILALLPTTLSYISLMLVQGLYVPTPRDLVPLSIAINKAENGTPSEATMCVLMAMLANNSAVCKGSFFVIENYSMILLFVSVGGAAAISTINELCIYSVANRRKCHDGMFDLFLIELIRSHPNEFEFMGYAIKAVSEEFLMEKVFSMISSIAMYFSSLNVAQQLLSLAAPLADGTYNRFSEMAITTFNSTLARIQRSQRPTMLYQSKDEFVQFTNIDTNAVKKGFTFNTWLMVDPPSALRNQIQPIIFSLSDDGTASIIVTLSGTSLFCQITSPAGASGINLTSSLPQSQWINISVIFNPRDDGTAHLIFTMNGENPNLFMIRDPMFVTEHCYIQIGGYTEQEQPSPYVFTMLGQSRLLRGAITMSELSEIMSHGALVLNDRDLIPDIEYAKEDYFKPITHFINNGRLSRALVGFFAFNAPTKYMERMVDIISSCGGLSDDLYQLVSYLLHRTKTDYSLYLRFYSLTTHNSAELLRAIILNLELWITCSNRDILRIVTHWYTVLYQDNSLDIWNVMSFQELLAMMRCCLYYNPIETDIIINRKRDPNIDVDAVRHVLLKILKRYPREMWTVGDVRALVSHIFTLKDQPQIVSLLGLLPMFDTPQWSDDIKFLLHNILIRPDNAVFVTAIRTILKLSGDSSVHINMFPFAMTPLHINAELLQLLKNEDEIVYATYSLISMIANSLTVDDCIETMTYLKTKAQKSEVAKQIAENRAWYIWPLLCTLRIPAEKQNDGLTFIYTIFMTSPKFNILDEMLSFIDAISIYTGIRTTGLTTGLLKLICDASTTTFKPVSYVQLIHRCARFGLFEFDNILHSDSLLAEYAKIFGEEVPEVKKEHGITEYKQIFEALLKAKEPHQLFFGINIENTENGPMSIPCDKLGRAVKSLIGALPKESINTTIEAIGETFDFFDRGKHNPKGRSLSTIIRNYYEVMSISYMSSMKLSIKVIYELLDYLYHESYGLSGRVTTETITASTGILAEVKMTSEQTLIDGSAAWATFSKECLIGTSIFSKSFEFSKDRLSRRLTSTFLCPFMLSKANIDPVCGNRKKIIRSPIIATLIKLSHKIPIMFDANDARIILESGKKTTIIKKSDIRRTIRYDTRVEIYTDYRSYLIDFGVSISQAIPYLTISSVPLPLNPAKYEGWMEYTLSNLELIIYANSISGRSYNISSMYPIMPRVLDSEGNILTKCPPIEGYDWLGTRDLVSVYNSDRFALSPEFFILPEFFEEIELPHGATPYEFVCKHRAALEKVDWVLEWLSLAFPSAFPESMKNRTKPEFSIKYTDFTIGAKISKADIAVGDGKVILNAITTNGDVIKFKADTRTGTSKGKRVANASDAPYFGLIPGGFATSDCPIIEAKTAFSFSEDGLIRDLDRGVSFSIAPQIAICAATSKEFGVTVIGTQSTQVYIFTIDGVFLRSFAARTSPTSLLLTRATSTIVAISSLSYSVYTLNGRHVGTRTLDRPCVCSCAFYEHFAVADSSGLVKVIDTRTLEVTETVIFSGTPVQLRIISSPPSIITVLRDGRLLIAKLVSI